MAGPTRSGSRTAREVPMLRGPHSALSRTEAIGLIHSLLAEQLGSKRRVLLSFDFAYGYPVDFGAALQAATGKSDLDLPWITFWQYLRDEIKDDEVDQARREGVGR